MFIFQEIAEKYPVFITRDFEQAKKWGRAQVLGSQQSGVLACSSAQRLKPEGIYVPTDIDVKNWFLASSDDLRSSNILEVAASEFKVQGLEIDWLLFAGMQIYVEVKMERTGLIILSAGLDGISEISRNKKDIWLTHIVCY